MWTQVILAAIAAAPDIIASVDRLMPGRGRGTDKLEAAAAQQRLHEPMVVETPALIEARKAKLSADVAYANALAAAAVTPGS
jgi:hypothetical protein